MRYIKEGFLGKLKNGKYAKVLNSIIHDDTLDLELRGDRIAVYYRGGKLFDLYDGKEYVVFNAKYGSNENPTVAVNEIENAIPSFKYSMDLYLSEHNIYEKEFQQLMVRVNNYTQYSNISKGTDYYIADFEYVSRSIGRFDLVGFKVDNYNLSTLSLIEMKYGKDSLDNECGIQSHLSSFVKIFENKSGLACLSEEMTKVLQQKYYLGLIPGLKAPSSDGLVEKMNAPKNMEVVFTLGDFNELSDQLIDELNSINPNDYQFDVFFAQSPFLGYGLYGSNFLSLRDVIERTQIRKKQK